jgi:hypothetical protein
MRRLVLPILAIAGFGMSGCWLLSTPVQHSRVRTAPPPSDSGPQNSFASSTYDDVPAPKPARRRVSVRTAPPASSAAAPAPVAPPTDTATNTSLSLSGEDASKANAERLLANVDRHLAHIDRTKLAPGDAATYDEANGFATSARRALATQDYVVASGLAQKASALTGRLGSSSH